MCLWKGCPNFLKKGSAALFVVRERLRALLTTCVRALTLMGKDMENTQLAVLTYGAVCSALLPSCLRLSKTKGVHRTGKGPTFLPERTHLLSLPLHCQTLELRQGNGETTWRIVSRKTHGEKHWHNPMIFRYYRKLLGQAMPAFMVMRIMKSVGEDNKSLIAILLTQKALCYWWSVTFFQAMMLCGGPCSCQSNPGQGLLWVYKRMCLSCSFPLEASGACWTTQHGGRGGCGGHSHTGQGIENMTVTLCAKKNQHPTCRREREWGSVGVNHLAEVFQAKPGCKPRIIWCLMPALSTRQRTV